MQEEIKEMPTRQIKILSHMIVITMRLLIGQKSKIGIMVILEQWDFCIGGHLAFRAALNKNIKATACFYATDLHTTIIPNKPGQHSMERLKDISGELLMIWGKQDTHVSTEALSEIRQKLLSTDIKFEWHEFNAQHAFMRDEGDRYDAELASICYEMAFRFLQETLVQRIKTMKIWINGEIKNFDENLTVYNLVKEIGVVSKKFAVECNGEIIPKSNLKDTLVKEGDKFEIVGAVGGG